eukprot:10998510-Lingulodinium_polyedra.AAC.1
MAAVGFGDACCGIVCEQAGRCGQGCQRLAGSSDGLERSTASPAVRTLVSSSANESLSILASIMVMSLP